MGTLPEGGLPKANLIQSISDTTLLQILDETAERLNYVLTAHIKFSHISDKAEKKNHAYSAEVQGQFYSKTAPDESIEFRIAGDAEKRTKTPFFNLIEITPRGALDITEEYVKQGAKVIQTFMEVYKAHGYQSDSRSYHPI